MPSSEKVESAAAHVVNQLFDRDEERDPALFVEYSTFRECYQTCILRGHGDFDFEGTYVEDPAYMAPPLEKRLSEMGLKVLGRNLQQGSYGIMIANPFIDLANPFIDPPAIETPFWKQYQDRVCKRYQRHLERTLSKLGTDTMVVKLPPSMQKYRDNFYESIAAKHHVEPVSTDPLAFLVHAK